MDTLFEGLRTAMQFDHASRFRQVYNENKKKMLGFPAWIADDKERQWHEFLKKGLPSSRNEDWKYTNLKSILPNQFALATNRVAMTRDRIAKECLECAWNLVLINGRFCPELSDDLPIGQVRLDSFCTSLETHEDDLARIRDLFAVELSTNPLVQLNDALAVDGLFLRVDPSVTLEKPIHILHVCHGGHELDAGEALLEDHGKILLPQVYLSLGRGSNSTFIERYLDLSEDSGAESNLYIGVNQIFLDDGAAMTSYTQQNLNSNTSHFSNNLVALRPSAVYRSTPVLSGAKVQRQSNQIKQYEGSTSSINGLCLGKKNQQCEQLIKVALLGESCSSEQQIRGIFDDQAKGVFQGEVFIAPRSQKVSAKQLNKNLLLSSQSQVNSKPWLRIESDDVKCSHGVTVSQVDPEHIFYLQTRGISQENCKQMMALGFASDVLGGVQDEEVKSILHGALTKYFS